VTSAERYASTLLSAFSQALKRACDAEEQLEQALARIAELEADEGDAP
jgi:hypothetical protein